MESQSEFEAVKQILATSPMFHMEADSKKLVVRRRRKFAPRRGAFRLLLPHSLAIISENTKSTKPTQYFVRPDSLAIFMTVMLIGAIAVEIFMDRATYPRDYPPAFVYALSTIYIGGLITEITYTKKQLSQLLEQMKR